MSGFDDKKMLTDEAMASVRNSGALATLKNVRCDSKPLPDKGASDALKQEAETVIENIQQYLSSNKVDGVTSQKLLAILDKIKGAMEKGTLSRASLAMALSEAAATMNGTDKASIEQQKTQQLWQRVEADNKAIDDDFDKMRKAGIIFGDEQWNKHKELTEYMKTHPHDLAKQKELDAVDDNLLSQANKQLKLHPEARPFYKDAKNTSDDRHQVVDKDLAAAAKGKDLVITNKDDDWDKDMPRKKQAVGHDFSIDDIAPQLVGQKQKTVGRQPG